MKNTPENKARFFAQYWGQDIIHNKSFKYRPGTYQINLDHIENDFLVLKQLYQLSDKDALEVARCLYPLAKQVKVSQISSTTQIELPEFSTRIDITLKREGIVEPTKIQFWDMDTGAMMQGTNINDMIDSIRRNGYTFPFDSIPVEKQIEWGWVKFQIE